MCKAPNLNLPNWKKPFCMEIYASKLAVAAVLFQMFDTGEKLPIAYHSRTISGNTDKIWSATEKRALCNTRCNPKVEDILCKHNY